MTKKIFIFLKRPRIQDLFEEMQKISTEYENNNPCISNSNFLKSFLFRPPTRINHPKKHSKLSFFIESFNSNEKLKKGKIFIHQTLQLINIIHIVK